MRHALIGLILAAATLPALAQAQYRSYGDELRYSVELVGRGWTGTARDGQPAGSGFDRSEPRSIVAMRIASDAGRISYRVMDVRGDWSAWVSDGSVARTRGLQVAAIQVRGEQRLGVRYRVFSRDAGWSSWQSDGRTAEARGREAVQAIQIELDRRAGGWDPRYDPWNRRDDRWDPRYDPRDDRYGRHATGVSYSVDLVGRGWTGTHRDGDTAGTAYERTPRSVRAVRINLNGGGEIRYRVRDVRGRWSRWESNGGEARASDLQVDAIQIQVSGGVGVRYRVFSEQAGWSPWARDGQLAEARGRQAVQAIQIEIDGRGGWGRNDRWDDWRR
ncbi:MAG TPA: hypothetical protein VM328_07355 [Fimbriimonadaceae bacterium]|nr:hypothetical protein [Fimbriimonadaceae bacterium]